MQDTERQKFEESWRKAFDRAESTPPESVWNSIELDLAGQESAAMKGKVVFYQGLAAAMLVFGLLAGAYAFYASTLNDERTASDGKRETRKEKRSTSDVQRSANNGQRSKTLDNNDSNSIQNQDPAIPLAGKKREQHSTQHQAAPADEISSVDPTQVEEQKEVVSTTASAKEEEIKEDEKSETEVVAALRQQLETPETIVEPKRLKRQNENLWLALGGSAGNYTPNTPTATTPSLSQSSFDAKGPILLFSTTPAPKPQPKVGSSYSVGIGVGKKFGRLVVQTGVNFNKLQITYVSTYDARTSSNITVAAMSDYIGNSGLTLTNEYTVSSTMDIVSIPVQLGYMIIDRRLGWQINGGISNDFFLRNTLVDKSGQRSRFTQEAGSESPYRSLNWSALASTELSYRIGQHYRVSLVPGARYSFNSILKNTNDPGKPIVLDIGFRFRYIFE